MSNKEMEKKGFVPPISPAQPFNTPSNTPGQKPLNEGFIPPTTPIPPPSPPPQNDIKPKK